jgi:hypothetical protein
MELDDVWRVYRTVVRGTTGQADARAELADLLASLEVSGALRLPKGRAGWDASASPPLPKWIVLAALETLQSERPDPRSIAWPPELLFAANARPDRILDDLLAIKTFLANGGRQRPLVPLRERSLQIFGDEKRLDGLLKTALFRDGHLTLELLRCYDVAPPLVFETHGNPVSATMLVIENLHTYDSFRRWNAAAGEYAAVVYGHGSEFRGTVRDVPRVCELLGVDRVEYFGDVDREGLCIPIQAQRSLAEIGNTIVLHPAMRWYELLLNVGQRRPAMLRELGPDGRAAVEWLGIPTGPAVEGLVLAGLRLAQEDVGTERLLEVDATSLSR